MEPKAARCVKAHRRITSSIAQSQGILTGNLNLLTSQNSLSACLHIPQGVQGAPGAPSSISLVTATALISPRFIPALTIAFPIAMRSAQVVTGYDAFSIFAPKMKVPSWRSREQPTRKWEYGPRRKSSQLPNSMVTAAASKPGSRQG